MNSSQLVQFSHTFIGDDFNLCDRVDWVLKAFAFEPDELSTDPLPDFRLNPFCKSVREACPEERKRKDTSNRLAKSHGDVWCDVLAQPIVCQSSPILELVLAHPLEAESTGTVDIRPTKLGIDTVVLHSLLAPSSSTVKIILRTSLFPAPGGSSLPDRMGSKSVVGSLKPRET